jgi:UDP-N-acetylglucosamine 2-epimerase (non-hydrolysing)
VPRIDVIAGARPNFMKIAAIIHALQRAMIRGSNLTYRLIHTGQHYDNNMSGSFFEELGIPTPNVSFSLGGGTNLQQVAGIILKYERLLRDCPSDLCLVVGDVSSTVSCAIAAQYLGVPVAHVEAGIRSNDWAMPEELNRILTDSISNWYFTTSEYANINLKSQGIDADRIFFVGNTMIDTLLSNRLKFRSPTFWNKYQLNVRNYLVLTLHRPSNVDEVEKLSSIIKIISDGTNGMRVIFPVHPRTRKTLDAIGPIKDNFILTEPMSYHEFMFIVENSKGIITDSGGISEEATVLNIPCLTLRDSTERPETVEIGTNILATCEEEILRAISSMIDGDWKQGGIPALWDGCAAERVVRHLEEITRTS